MLNYGFLFFEDDVSSMWSNGKTSLPGVLEAAGQALGDKDDLKTLDDADKVGYDHMMSQMEKMSFDDFNPKPYVSHVQKRSTYRHLRRCYYLIKTPCCRRFSNTMFIGMVKP